MNSCDDRKLAAELGVHLLQFNRARFGNLRRALFLQLGFFELAQVGFWITVVSCASKPEGHSAKIYCCEGLSGGGKALVAIFFQEPGQYISQLWWQICR